MDPTQTAIRITIDPTAPSGRRADVRQADDKGQLPDWQEVPVHEFDPSYENYLDRMHRFPKETNQ